MCFKYFIISEPAPFIRFYRVYVVPIVIYCSSIYVFVRISNIKNVERIQKYFTKRLYARIHPNQSVPKYKLRLVEFGLDSLEVELLCFDLLNFYKLMHGLYFVPDIDFKHSAHLEGRLAVSRVRTSKRRNFYISRVITLWNRYASCCCSSNLSEFRSYLSNLRFDSSLKASL